MIDSILKQLKECFTKPLKAFCLCALLLFGAPSLLFLSSADARCPDGTHKSPSGDCEAVTHSGGLPRCPDGFHRSPNGDCERVSSGNIDNSRSSDSEDDGEDNDESDREIDNTNNNGDETARNDEAPILNSQPPSGCRQSFYAIANSYGKII